MGVRVNYVWLEQLERILEYGNQVLPRGLPCREMLGQEQLIDMGEPLLTVEGRDLSFRFAATEALWILTGDSRLRTLLSVAPSYGRFSDDGTHLNGAYGPKFISQCRYVVDTLTSDPHSRQAVMTFWERNPRPSRDIPCTISHQYFRRDQKLHLLAHMRSNDIWLGWPYDVFSFTMMAAYVALHIKPIELGHLYLTIGSQHLYSNNEISASELLRSNAKLGRELRTFDIGQLNSPRHLLECLECVSNTNLRAKLYTGVDFFDSMIEVLNEREVSM